MAWAGNYSANQTVYLPFPSTNANGTPFVLANGTVTCYKLNNTTEFSNNITLTASFDSRPGFNLLTLNTSLNANFTTGADYQPILTVGDVNGVDIANMTLDWFSIENRHLGTTAQAAQLSNANGSLSNGTASGGGGITMPTPLNFYGQFDTQTGDSASKTLPTRPSGAAGALVTPSGGSVTWRGDGGDAASDGSPLAAGSSLPIANVEAFRWCASASVQLKIQWLRA